MSILTSAWVLMPESLSRRLGSTSAAESEITCILYISFSVLLESLGFV